MAVQDVFAGLRAGLWLVGGLLALAAASLQVWAVALAAVGVLVVEELVRQGARIVFHAAHGRRRHRDAWPEAVWAE